MKVFRIVYLIFLLINFALAETLNCDAKIIKRNSNYCEIRSSAFVAAGENLTISNVDPYVLTSLSLRGTEFTTIPQNTFINFPRLQILYISHNNLSELKIDDFKNALRLKELFIYNTQLQVIPSQIFHLCPEIEKLIFSLNPIHQIDEEAFGNLRKLKNLNLESLPLLTFPENMLVNMTALEEIKLENCSIKSLPEDFFHNNLKLTKIFLNQNQLDSLPDEIFNDLKNLKFLNVEFNNLMTLPVSKSQEIHARNNKLQQFHIPNSAVVVDVQNNLITKVTCEENLNVEIVFFNNNSLSTFDCFSDMTNALQIFLNDNKFSNLNAEFFKNLQKVSVFKINNNTDLKVSEEVFSPLKNVRELWVDALTGYENLKQNPKLSMLFLTTKSWNCSYLKQVADTLSTQKIYLRFIDEYEDFINFKCQLKMWDISK